jgi:acyl-CoA reductase-like NAD-dependent aldehyde dehydrogenase
MKLKMYIDGQWVEGGSGAFTPLRSPATGEVLRDAPIGSPTRRSAATVAREAARAGWEANTPCSK